MGDTNFYTGIGSREIPGEVQTQMMNIAFCLREGGWTLRSGGAPGADLAFEMGAGAGIEIWIPWQGFHPHGRSVFHRLPTEAAYDLAKSRIPHYTRVSRSVQRIFARNMHQVLGADLETPSKFVVYWQKKRGGTQYAVDLARDWNVPTYNLANSGESADFYAKHMGKAAQCPTE